MCVGTERTVEAIRARGLALVHDGERTVTHPEAVVRLEGPVSLLVVAVKAYDLDEALGRVEPSALRDAVVLPLLNGLEHVERIRALRGALARRRARPSWPARSGGSRRTRRSPASWCSARRARSSRPRAMRSTQRVSTRRSDRSRVPGIDVVVATGERAVLWEKAARLAVLAAATVASGLTVGALRADPVRRERLREALDEACAVADADGVRLDPAGQWAIIDALPAELTTSTARDARAGRPTELDAITGSVVRAGARLGVPTPALAGLLEEARCRAP